MKFTGRSSNILFSNLMGPQIPLSSLPGKGNIEGMFNGTNPTTFPITCGLMSYYKNVQFSLVVDESIMSDPKEFMHEINEAFLSQSQFLPLPETSKNQSKTKEIEQDINESKTEENITTGKNE